MWRVNFQFWSYILLHNEQTKTHMRPPWSPSLRLSNVASMSLATSGKGWSVWTESTPPRGWPVWTVSTPPRGWPVWTESMPPMASLWGFEFEECTDSICSLMLRRLLHMNSQTEQRIQTFKMSLSILSSFLGCDLSLRAWIGGCVSFLNVLLSFLSSSLFDSATSILVSPMSPEGDTWTVDTSLAWRLAKCRFKLRCTVVQ